MDDVKKTVNRSVKGADIITLELVNGVFRPLEMLRPAERAKMEALRRYSNQ